MRLKVLVAVGALAATLSGCADYSALAYRRDDSISFSAPHARSLVTLPVALRWTDSRPLPGGSYALFVDRSPMKPRKTLRDLFLGDTSCKHDPKCPDRQYLADRGIYTTSDTQLTLTSVAPLASDEKVQLHEVDVVRLDSFGRRVGEDAWFVPFKLAKRTFG